ncbi:amino acid permease [Azospirillum ramasamyi]|uniref:Amino acid permease n=2 Tax=Azospirillum ramasamyi TaxID=682998 RepID=A0A2U9S134_9PROT|nr:amino acid permease [Azospirillum ramasamyi]
MPPQMPPVMSMWGVVALGIGSMIGAGIFALLGQATLIAGKDVLLSFLVGGVIALLSGGSFARLAARYPRRGGLIDYLAEAFPGSLFARSVSLVYLVTLIVSVAVVGKSFGAYAAQLVFGMPPGSLAANVLTVLMVLAVAGINLAGAGTVGRIEIALVATKLGVLVLLIGASLGRFDPQLLMKTPDVGWATLMSSIGLTFFAYAGFGMMANASASVAEPQKTMPRAIFIAIALVTFFYLALAAVVLGNVSMDQLRRYTDSAVAVAARPALGQAGYIIVTFGGLLATASATNATLFSILNLNAELGRQGTLPRAFGRIILHAPLGFSCSVAAALILVVAFPLSAIASLAGMFFLMAYIAVFAAHWRLRREAGGRRLFIILGAASMGCVLLGSAISLGREQPSALALGAVILVACAAGEWLIMRRR